MAKKLNKMNPRHAKFWQAAFLAAEVPVLVRLHPKRASAGGTAHLAGEYADAAVAEFNMRFPRS